MSHPMISPASTAASVPSAPTPEPTPAPTPEPAEIDAMRRGPEWHEACNRFNAGDRSPDLYAFALTNHAG